MNQKRNRSVNWDEEEKKLFRSVLKEYSHVIENKSTDTNTNKIKTKAWEDVHKKFNKFNSRHRQLKQLKIQWKMMKVNARKTYSTFQREASKTGGGVRPPSPNDEVIETKDPLNLAESLTDQTAVLTAYDSNGIDLLPMTHTVKDVCINNINEESKNEINEQITNSKDDDITVTPMTNMMGTLPVPKRKVINIIPQKRLKFRKDHDDYVDRMVNHSKLLKEEEHKRRLEMAEEEHSIKMAILNENLKSAILEREILEIKKTNMNYV